MYTSQVAVLSTIHVPGGDALDDLAHTHLSFTSPETPAIFVQVPLRSQQTDTQDWLVPILEWARQNYAEYIKFDPRGATVADLPTYPDAWR